MKPWLLVQTNSVRSGTSLILLLIAFLTSCGPGVTDDEQHALDMVAKSLKAKNITLQKTKTVGRDGFTYTLKLEVPVPIDSLAFNVQVIGSNMAHVFNSNLKDVSNLSEILCSIKDTKGKTISHMFEREELNLMVEQNIFYDAIADIVQNQNYERLEKRCHPEFLEYSDPSELTALHARIDSSYGTVDSSRYLGYSKVKTEDGKKLDQMLGIQYRGGKKFMVYLTTYPEDPSILGIQYTE